MKDFFVDITKLKTGLHVLDDTTNAPIGSLRKMKNVQITDRGGIAPRPGTEQLGTDESSSSVLLSAFNFKKSFSSNEIILKSYSTKLRIYSKNHPNAGWFDLKNDFTSDKEFGFATSLVNTDFKDYVLFSNRYDSFYSWDGAVAQITEVLVGGETVVKVDSLLTSEILYSATATANSATTLTVSTANWAASQWNNCYIYIPSTGKIRKITATTTTQVTFDTLGSGPGNVAFQIRNLAFPESGTIIYNGTKIAYTTVDVYNQLPVSSAHAAPINSGVATIPTEYPSNPRGNRFANYLARIIVGNVRSAVARDSGGALQGYSSAGSAFVSKQKVPTDFSYSATRVAGEGDVISMPYGGGDITDVQPQENSVYVFKKSYVEEIQYSQDSNDLATRTPLKPGLGSIGKTIRGSDDIYFFTEDGKLTTLGRAKLKDLKPQTENIGYYIKRLLDTYYKDNVCGFEYKDKIYVSLRSTDTITRNDVTIIYNKKTKSFEGIWDIGAVSFFIFNSEPYFAASDSLGVFKMLTGTSDIIGSVRYPFYSDCEFNLINFTPSKAYLQALNGIYFEGYITGLSSINFKVFKGFDTDPFLQFTFTGTEEEFLSGAISGAYLGGNPLGLHPMGTISTPDQDGRRHFKFRVYFPFQYDNYFTFGWNSQDSDNEIIRAGLMVKEDFSINQNQVKNI